MTTFAFLIEPPFNCRRLDGSPTGCDVELARIVFGMIGKNNVEFVETEFAQLLPGLQNGRWQMTTGLFATDDRRRIAAFSRPIWALPDGLLVRRDNPLQLAGYRTIAETPECVLAIVRDQIQHRTAIEFGVSAEQILIFETYVDAAHAVADGKADAYASVARAHSGFLSQNPSRDFEVVTVGVDEKAPAFGSFAFRKSDEALRQAVDDALQTFLGSSAHRAMMQEFGFCDEEIDLVVN
jgi:polar amino acid transport system substrate-binding protein